MNELSTLRNLSYQKSLLSSSIYPADKNTVQNLIVSRLPTHDKPLGKAAAHHFSRECEHLRVGVRERLISCCLRLCLDGHVAALRNGSTQSHSSTPE